jgi:hypothetical protein
MHLAIFHPAQAGSLKIKIPVIVIMSIYHINSKLQSFEMLFVNYNLKYSNNIEL